MKIKVKDLAYKSNREYRLGSKVEQRVAPVAVRYACPICRELYDTADEAAACMSQPDDDGGWSLGDVCVAPGEYFGPHDPPTNGFEHWLAYHVPARPQSDDHFDRISWYVPWRVVTHIGHDAREPHRLLVTLATLYRGCLDAGWNPANGEGHCPVYRPGVPLAEQRGAIDGRGGPNPYWWDDFGDIIFNLQPSADLRRDAEQLGKIVIQSQVLL